MKCILSDHCWVHMLWLTTKIINVASNKQGGDGTWGPCHGNNEVWYSPFKGFLMGLCVCGGEETLEFMLVQRVEWHMCSMWVMCVCLFVSVCVVYNLRGRTWLLLGVACWTVSVRAVCNVWWSGQLAMWITTKHKECY